MNGGNHNSVIFDLGDSSCSAEWMQIRKLVIEGRRVIFCISAPNEGDGFSYFELLESEVDDLQKNFAENGYMKKETTADPLPERFHNMLRSRCQSGAVFKAFRLVFPG